MSYCKQILRVPKRASNTAVRLELGRKPILFDIINMVVKYYCRFQLITKASRYHIDKAFNFVCKFLNIDPTKYDLTNKAENQRLINYFKDTLETLYNDQWYTSIYNDNEVNNTKNKLRTYRTFKKQNVLEPYLKYISNPNLRSEMTKLRISAHSLRIESDRVKKLELSKRICLHCDLDEIEDKTHFLLKCPLYQTERHNLFTTLNINLDIHTPKQALIKIMQHHCKYTANLAAIYINKLKYMRQPRV